MSVKDDDQQEKANVGYQWLEDLRLVRRESQMYANRCDCDNSFNSEWVEGESLGHVCHVEPVLLNIKDTTMK